MNALDHIRIRTDSEVTEQEAVEVVEWCREWYADCVDVFYDSATGDYAGPESISIPALLRGCDRHIEGGLRFVLEDVRATADYPEYQTLKRAEEATGTASRAAWEAYNANPTSENATRYLTTSY